MSKSSLAYKGSVKPIIPGPCSGEVVLVDGHISFFGEIDPEQGCLINLENVCFRDKILIFKGTRGSTVAPYVIYALRRNNIAPRCMLVAEVEPMLIAGCVLAEIPLFIVEKYEELVELVKKIHSKVYLEVCGNVLLLYKKE
ncbi:MAG: DUF126 domain-containing protein [Desulfurococcaceae archaeon]|nr:DUF126 domain-containing protein [Desulfurococcaceae archaeon]